MLAVIGDNGAGKSTLIKCLSGAMIPDAGDDARSTAGRSASKSTQEARAAGIETVYQTLAVAPALDIASNLFLARESAASRVRSGRSSGCSTPAAMKRHAKEHIDELGITTLQNINQAVETLSGGQRQAVAVARARPPSAARSSSSTSRPPPSACGRPGRCSGWSVTCATAGWASS